MSNAGKSQHSFAVSEAAAPRNVASSPISSSQTKRCKVRANHGRSSVTGESSKEGSNQSFFMDDEGNSMTAEMLAQLRKTYDIPSSVKFQSFEYGLRLPIQLFFAQILSGLGVAPAQLSSMAWRNLAGLYILWKEMLGVEPSIEDVHAIFTLTTALKKPGLYYLKMYTGKPHLVPHVNLNATDKAWDDFWFVVSGDWGQTVVEDGEMALGGEVSTPSSVTRKMAEGSKTDLAFLHLVRDGMAKVAGIPSQRAVTGSDGSGKRVATSNGLPP
ncbi:Myristoylated alanine-rich C-kinase [Melia azedarach]|uniref:Myristoylated alanine-rich C-kinase n=1 Tax=Melia azedarach TaxID=155640 RepID=A0ACC1XV09_MELAZ|nr:Myristoylated alanine-rich C-kinase [Melia azedarach]